ncbi:MAG: pilus assembly FimT family protein [Terrimicrobiaceae bacterium]
MLNSPQDRFRKSRGFSILELLLVISVIAIMMSLLLPAVAGFSSTAGRRGAVNILMNTFEQARVAALESGQNVYVGFADSDFPVEDMRYAAFIVFRDATDQENPNHDKPYIVLKKWTRLPKNIALKSNITASIISSGKVKTFDSNLQYQVSTAQVANKFPAITFNSSGAIEEPSGVNKLFLLLYEGYYSEGQDNHTRNKTTQESSAGLFEKISLSRYTGRAQLDITATGS